MRSRPKHLPYLYVILRFVIRVKGIAVCETGRNFYRSRMVVSFNWSLYQTRLHVAFYLILNLATFGVVKRDNLKLKRHISLL